MTVSAGGIVTQWGVPASGGCGWGGSHRLPSYMSFMFIVWAEEDEAP